MDQVSKSVKDHLKDAWEIAWDTIHRFGDDDCMHLAAGIAYYSLLSMFPLVMLLTSIAAFFYEPDEATEWLVERLGDHLPVTEEFLSGALEGVHLTRGPLAAIGVIGMLFGSTMAFGATMRALNRAWGLGGRIPRSFLRSKAWEFGFLGAIAVLFLLSLAATGLFETALEPAWWILHYVVPFVFVTSVFFLLYKFGPAIDTRWSDIWLPAVLAGVVFEGAKHIFTWYVSNLAQYSAVYGSIATVIILLIWVYFAAGILLFGAELSYTLADRRGHVVDG